MKSLYLSIILSVGILSLSFRASGQTASFTASANAACTPTTINFTATGEKVTSWAWDFGNSNTDGVHQNPSASYPDPGTYTVKLTINGDPLLFTTQTILVYPRPNPTITSATTEGCAPYSTTLTASATPVVVAPFAIGSSSVGGITGGAASSYTWNFFGKLSTVTKVVGTDANPTQLALTNIPAGIYDVLLTVTDEHGCSNSVFKQSAITVNPKPAADFTFSKSNPCGTGNVNFTGTASVTTGTIASYVWDFGDPASGAVNNSSSLQNPTHNYSAVGIYHVTYTVNTAAGCSSAPVTKDVSFNSTNLNDFSFTGSCVNQSVSFSDASSTGVVSWAWDFENDGNTDATIQNPTFTYTSAGDKTAKLTKTFTDGCVMVTTKTVAISGATPTFTYSTSATCSPSVMLIMI